MLAVNRVACLLIKEDLYIICCTVAVHWAVVCLPTYAVSADADSPTGPMCSSGAAGATTNSWCGATSRLLRQHWSCSMLDL